LHLRVDLSDGRCTLVLEGGHEGADEEMQYVDVAQDLDPSPEGPKANLASEGKPRIINLVL
jgi:c-di-GMP-binding flagellar brake protein YcgR